MKTKKRNDIRRIRIKYRIRKSVRGTAERPRMNIFRSNKQIYIQFIDDLKGNTLLAVSSQDDSFKNQEVNKVKQAEDVGKLAAEKALAAGIENVVFDRNGYLYHGRVKSLSEAARKAGLKF